MSDRSKIAVIGSGFGGLAAAIRMQSAGFQVELFEKRDKPGGRAYVYEDQGFVFDAGPTVITAPHCLEELFELTGRRLEDYIELIPVEPLYRLYWDDGYQFDYTNDWNQLIQQIGEKNPEDVEGYKKFLDYSKEVFDAGYDGLVDYPFMDWWSMIRVAPQLARLSAHRSVYSMVSKFIKDPHLRQGFSFHSLLIGGSPFTSSSIYTLIHYLERKWGILFAKGGTNKLVLALVRLFEEIGGKVHLNEPVLEIETEGREVQAVRTEKDRYIVDAVISNADVVHTYDQLLKDVPLARPMQKRVKRQSHSMSLFLIYFGVKKQYPDIAHHNVIFGPRYKELLKDIFQRGKLADDFSLYLHAPGRTDPSLAPKGCDGLYVLSPVPNLGKLDLDWEQEGPKYADKILEYLESKYLPDLRKNIVTQRIFTPTDFKTELNAHLGSAFSLEPILTQSAFFRTHNRDDRIKNLYFVGAGTHPGAGVPGVVNSGKATARIVLDDLGGIEEAIEADRLNLNNRSPDLQSPEAPSTEAPSASSHGPDLGR